MIPRDPHNQPVTRRIDMDKYQRKPMKRRVTKTEQLAKFLDTLKFVETEESLAQKKKDEDANVQSDPQENKKD